MTTTNPVKNYSLLPDSTLRELLTKYASDNATRQLIFVKHTGGSSAHLTMYEKTTEGWTEILSCPAFIGENGMGKAREGDSKTPEGIFGLPIAFGIKDDPGAKIPYAKVNENLYWCGDEQYYNQLIDITEKPHNCQGEHLIDYAPQYNYGMFIDYNKEGIYGEGSAIFLHCTGSKNHTAGCVAVSEPDMITILQHAEEGSKICICR